MPPDKNVPQDPKSNEPGKIDLDKILLPKKEVHDPANAERVNAGALLQQEQSAALPKTEVPPIAPVSAPGQPPKEEDIVRPLETFQGDIERLVQQKNVSVVSIAAAEAARRSQASVTPPVDTRPRESVLKKWLSRILMILVGLTLLGAATGILFFVYLKTQPLSPLSNAPASPFIIVDETVPLVLPAEGAYRATLMSELEDKRQNFSLALGLLAQIYMVKASTTLQRENIYTSFDAREFVSTLSPVISPELTRTMLPEPYLFGFHSFEGNQAFLILQVDSYQQGYSGMLKWEINMYNDLAPLFTRVPRARIPEENISTTTAPAKVIQTKFVDVVIENRDVRAVVNENGDPVILWTFLDRSTIVITTNPFTLREIVSRFTSTPVTI